MQVNFAPAQAVDARPNNVSHVLHHVSECVPFCITRCCVHAALQCKTRIGDVLEALIISNGSCRLTLMRT